MSIRGGCMRPLAIPCFATEWSFQDDREAFVDMTKAISVASIYGNWMPGELGRASSFLSTAPKAFVSFSLIPSVLCCCPQGKYVFKLLAVDVPSASGAEERIYLHGDDKIYSRCGAAAPRIQQAIGEACSSSKSVGDVGVLSLEREGALTAIRRQDETEKTPQSV
jgi:hypothetical protein